MQRLFLCRDVYLGLATAVTVLTPHARTWGIPCLTCALEEVMQCRVLATWQYAPCVLRPVRYVA